jgi:hypothetical protein
MPADARRLSRSFNTGSSPQGDTPFRGTRLFPAGWPASRKAARPCVAEVGLNQRDLAGI